MATPATAEAAAPAMAAEVEDFLSKCSQSGDSAYGALKTVLERLEAPATRSAARSFLAAVRRRFASPEAGDECFRTYHFRIHDVYLNNLEGQKRQKLTMMEIPSIFVPEDWSFTFYEGLNRQPDSIFRERTVSELGCGNGWISIALAEKWLPLKVYGLDINPRAVKIAQINLFLNALNDDGVPVYDEEGKTLLDRVEFHESDLLGYCRDNKIELERIIGCIPQILNPNPEAMSKIITENSSEEFLYDLSNYCALQGFVEDQFGLGLIARAVEEGIAVIKPMGIMIFNMGGRPGHAVCERLFQRRGFQIERLWQTKVMQAADTDISALVEIERNSPHRFEFFMGLVNDRPICARTAWAYMKSGGRISHALTVYSCQLRQPNHIKKIFEFLKDGLQEVSSSLDLSFEDDSAADEKIPFLASLATFLKENIFIPYEPPAGCLNFRNLVAGFMRNYHHIPLTADNVTVFPSRAAAIENVIQLFSPRLAIVDDRLSKNLPKQWLISLAIEHNKDKGKDEEDTITVIEAPHQSDLLGELIRKLKPEMVVAGMADFESITSSAFESLLRITEDVNSRLLLDISDHLELSSVPSSNGVLKYLAGHALPSHAAILCGLVKDKVYNDLEVAFVISEDPKICSSLSKAVELFQGHTALFSQQYYECIFHELLAFQITDRHPLAERQCGKSDQSIGLSSSTISVLNEAELFVTHPVSPPVIHMDLDHNFLQVPTAVKASVFESFARQNISDLETDVLPGIQQLVRERYGFPMDSSSDIICGNSTLALFNKVILCCKNEGGILIFPTGTNGHYVSAAKFLRVSTVTIPTKSESGFKIAPDDLRNTLKTVKRPWLYLSGPTINPSGSLYSDEEIRELLSVCAEFGTRVVIDTSFSGLEFQTDGRTGWNLQQSLDSLAGKQSPFCVSLLGSLSSELLAGGIEFTFLIMNDTLLIDAFGAFPSVSRPHITLKYAVRKLLGLRNQKADSFCDAVRDQKMVLKSRAEQLEKTLTSCGWDVVSCSGGISLMAKPTAYAGKPLKLNSFDSKLDDTNIRDALLISTGLAINSSKWTGAPGFCRFCFALCDADFEETLRRIMKFKEHVLGPSLGQNGTISQH